MFQKHGAQAARGGLDFQRFALLGRTFDDQHHANDLRQIRASILCGLVSRPKIKHRSQRCAPSGARPSPGLRRSGVHTRRWCRPYWKRGLPVCASDARPPPGLPAHRHLTLNKAPSSWAQACKIACFALDPAIVAAYPAAETSIERIGYLLDAAIRSLFAPQESW